MDDNNFADLVALKKKELEIRKESEMHYKESFKFKKKTHKNNSSNFFYSFFKSSFFLLFFSMLLGCFLLGFDSTHSLFFFVIENSILPLFTSLTLLTLFFFIPEYKKIEFNKKNEDKYEEKLELFRSKSFEADAVQESIDQMMIELNLGAYLSEQSLSFYNNLDPVEKHILSDFEILLEFKPELNNYFRYNNKNNNYNNYKISNL